MFQRLSKAVFLAILFCFCLSCGFMDLRPIGVSTVPNGPWFLLPGAESPVIVAFDTEVEKSMVERALQVYSPAGTTDGQLRWEGNSLHFIPDLPWKAGIRYGLRLSGYVIALDGRELILSMDIPFYAITRSELPYLESFFPSDSASVSTSESNILELNFSHPMDIRSTEDALKLDIPGQKFFEWLDNGKTLRLSSDKPLDPWIVYRWSIQEKALSWEGAPLAKEFSGRFITDLDREFIKVLRVIPLLPPEKFAAASPPAGGLWGRWTPAAPSMEQGLGFGHGIGVEFNKPPEIESLRRAFSFAPSISGTVEILSPVSAVFIPARNPDPETFYSLFVSGSLRDTEGLRMGDDYALSFKTDIPYLRILSFSPDGKTASALVPETGSSFSVPVNAGGIAQFYIDFSLALGQEDKLLLQEAVFKISLRPLFPANLPPVSLRTARWMSPDRLLMEWEGLLPGKQGEFHYYRMIIPGGAGGVHNGRGSYLNEDFILYLEAVE